MERRTLNKLNLIIYIAIIFISFWIGYLIIYGSGGIIQRKNIERELCLLVAEIKELEKEKEMTDLQIRNLKNNKKYIEAFARELGYKKEGEIIFKFIEKKKNK